MIKIFSIFLLFIMPSLQAQELLTVDDVMKFEAGMPVNKFVKVIRDASSRLGQDFNLSDHQDEDIPDELLDIVDDKAKLRSYGTSDFSIQVYDSSVIYIHLMLENVSEADQARLDQFYDSQWEKDSRLAKRSPDMWMNKGNVYSFRRYMDGTIQIHTSDLKFIPQEKVDKFKAELYTSTN